MGRTYCSEVLSLAPPRAQSEPRGQSDVQAGSRQRQVMALLIVERVDGFFLQQLTQLGEHVGETRHDTLDEAMSYATSAYDAISDWRFCPDDVEPLEYLHARSDP
jgi:hypothetical protein